MRRTISLAITILCTALTGVALSGSAAYASTAGDFVSKINAERRARGLSTLNVNSTMASSAREQSARMARESKLFHSTDLGEAVSGWTRIGENVGTGRSVGAIHDALMGSSGHRANILGRFNAVGVGVVESDGTLWVTQIFAMLSSSDETSGTVRRETSSTDAVSEGARSLPARVAPAPTARRTEPKARVVRRERTRTVAVLLRLTELA